jgi:predicted nucleotidyltransferase
MSDTDINDYIAQLVSKYTDIKSVWLFGSRANETETNESDWDLLVFASDKTLSKLRNDNKFKQEKIDMLVVIDGDSFEEPWYIDQPKKGSLSNWNWKIISPAKATYTGTKEPTNGSDWYRSEVTIQFAIRLWVKPNVH